MTTACSDGGSPGATITIVDASGGDGSVVVPDGSTVEDGHSPDDAGPVIECKNDLDCVLGYGNVGICQKPMCNTESGFCELNVKESCCEEDGECDDGDPCTDDSCPQAGGTCVHEPRPTECSADSDCKAANVCETVACVGECGVCEATPIADCCLANDECDDGDACTADDCNSQNTCASTPIACDDGDECTTDSCAPDSGCVHEDIPNCGGCENDAACDDGNACTKDTCGPNGACVTADLVCDDGDPCTADGCDADTGCVFETIPGCGGCTSNAQCEDAEPCTENVCQDDGSCVFNAIPGCCEANSDCTDDDACTTDSCLFGQCVFVVDTTCCTQDLQCVDANPCTSDQCLNNTCVNTAVPDCCAEDVQCDDADPCTEDTCTDGSCTNTPTTDCCENNSECDDGDKCTINSCLFGQCVTQDNPDCCSTNADCETDSACKKGSCLFGECVYDVVPDCCEANGDCDDGNVCTTDVCTGGACTNEEKPGCCASDKDCDDGNSCTENSCLFGECIATGDPNCCVDTSDCDDGNSCTKDSCLFGECLYANIENCCTSAADCDDGNSCTTDTCSATGKCINQGDADCCQPSDGESIATFSFVPNVIDGWYPDPDNGWYRWRETQSNSFKGAGSMYFGNSSGEHYCSSQSWIGAGSGTATLPIESEPYPSGNITIPAGVSAWATFYVWLDMRTNPAVDKFVLSVVTKNGTTAVWSKASVPTTSYKKWVPMQADLSVYAGQTVQLQFSFDVVDKETDGGCYNAGTGPHVDELSLVVANCDGGCSSDSECTDPPNSCFAKQGSCVDGACEYPLTGDCCETAADCDDADPCSNDACIVGSCQHQPILGCCQETSDCASGNECVKGSCDLNTNTCGYEFVGGAGCCVTAVDCDIEPGYCAPEASCIENQCDLVPPIQSQTLMNFVFTEEIDGWQYNSNSAYRWRESDKQSKSPSLSLYFGNEQGTNYCSFGQGGSGFGQGGVANLPGGETDPFPTGTIAFDATGTTTLNFWVYADIRTNPNVDELLVQLERTDGAVIPVWTKADLGEGDYQKWIEVSVDVTYLAPFEGRARALFEVGNPWVDGGCDDGGAGPFLDDITLIQTCGK